MESQILREYIIDNPKHRFGQCDILKDLTIVSQSDINESNKATISETNLQYAIVVNQECDLEHDYDNRSKQQPTGNQDKILPNLLIVPAYLAEYFKIGTHRGIKYKCTEWGGEQWKNIKSNQHNRFHYLALNSEFQIPELIIDFKHVYTINIEVAYKKKESLYHVSLCELYRDNLSQRYTNYLSRIGLPDKTSV